MKTIKTRCIISPHAEEVYKNYFDSLEKKKKQLKRIKKLEKVLLFGKIDNDTVALAMESIEALIRGRIQAIDLIICSEGGYIDYGFALMDYMIKLPVPIITTAYGNVKSAAVNIFQLGAIRRMMPLSGLLMHLTDTDTGGSPDNILKTGKFLKHREDLLFKIISLKSGIPLQKLKKMSSPLVYFTPEEAIKWNLADEII